MTEFTLTEAQRLDAADPLRSYRERFHIPQHHDGTPTVYFTGNSLGLQPKSTATYIQRELEHWATNGVEGHFRGEMPWKDYHHFFKTKAAKIVGALPEEVVIMNTLTVNLHLLMMSFYRPTATRFKIIMEGGAFPSDQYAVESQVRINGFEPEVAIIEVNPREGEYTLRTEDILATIEEHGAETALVMFSGINYYTGQVFDMKAITEAGHKVGAKVGFDLAHAAGNVMMHLHDWNVDFAVWCTYKYLNSSPGGSGGMFVHQRHASNPDLLRLAGWWGHDEAERFKMRKGFKPMHGADGWQLSNAQVLSMSAHLASLDIFDEVGMPALKAKSEQLVAFMLLGLKSLGNRNFTIITPEQFPDRGCQTSILTDDTGKQLFDYLSDNGVIADWREPNVIRIAPVPLYNSFEDIFRFVEYLRQA